MQSFFDSDQHPDFSGGRVAAKNSDWVDIQLHMQRGVCLTPLLPLGHDAAFVWVPKNGCSTLKHAWLRLNLVDPSSILDVHCDALRYTNWLTERQFRALSQNRSITAVWRDPIDRFVSACRSHLKELTAARFAAKLRNFYPDDSSLAVAMKWHQMLFADLDIRPFTDEVEPCDAMNSVAQRLPAWISAHLDWSHHVLPQVQYLGFEPTCYQTILGMDQITSLVDHWSRVSGLSLGQSALHVSASMVNNDPWRGLNRNQLTSSSVAALCEFYKADWDFIELARKRLGLWPGFASPHP